MFTRYQWLAGCLAAHLAAASGAQTIWHVNEKATGAGTGLSWTDAFVDVQKALAVAAAGDQIWVAKGKYTPSDNDATLSFNLVDGVSLYGGFAGSESQLSERNWTINETILSGDIGRDDIVGSGQFWYLNWNRNTANSGHVITALGVGPTAIVDGFTIADGATGPDGTPAGDPLMYGSGIYCISASPTVRNCTFTHNLAAFGHGGGAYILDGSPLFENCKFLENYVHLGNGGGLSAYGNSTPTIRDCEFSRNVAVHGGSGGQGMGAGVHLWTGQAVTIERCLFDQNLAKYFYAVGGLDPARGAGLFCFTSPVSLFNCTFTRNQANQGGGAFTFGPTTYVNCLFADNKAVPQPNDPYPELGGDGAGLATISFQAVSTQIINCTVVNNSAKKYAGASAWQNATFVVENDVFWGNVASDPTYNGYWEAQLTKAFDTIGYSCVQNLFGPPKEGEDPIEPEKRPGCIEQNPKFVGGGFALSAGSPCIDAARNATVPPGVTFDLAGKPRFADDPLTPDTGLGTPPIVDMGAYEFQVFKPGDLNGDGKVDQKDLGIELAAYGTCVGQPGFNPIADIDGDGCVGQSDLGVLLANWTG